MSSTCPCLGCVGCFDYRARYHLQYAQGDGIGGAMPCGQNTARANRGSAHPHCFWCTGPAAAALWAGNVPLLAITNEIPAAPADMAAPGLAVPPERPAAPAAPRWNRSTRSSSSASSTKVEPQHQGGTTAATVDDIAATVAPMVSALESLSARIGTMEQLVGSLVEKVAALEQLQQQWNLRWDAEDGGGDEHQNWPPAPVHQ